MKKISALIVIAILTAAAFTATAQFRYGPTAGITVNTLSFSQDLIDVEQVAGAQGGIMGELMFPGIGVGIDFGLLYNLMGANVNFGQREIWKTDGFGKSRVDIHNLSIPLNVRFKWTRMNGFEDYLAPIVYAGPQFNIAVGHNKISGHDGATNPLDYAGGDLGLTVGLGVEVFKHWQLTAQYTWGMTYITETRKLDNYSAQNRQWAVRLAYFF